jgi:hypothetical protein
LVGFLEEGEGVVPLLAAHCDYTEVGIRGTGAGIGGEDGAEIFLGGVEVIATESIFTLREEGLRG